MTHENIKQRLIELTKVHEITITHHGIQITLKYWFELSEQELYYEILDTTVENEDLKHWLDLSGNLEDLIIEEIDVRKIKEFDSVQSEIDNLTKEINNSKKLQQWYNEHTGFDFYQTQSKCKHCGK